ncbi:MAG TPA: hypothetical protein VF573_23630 [Paraburkholderia sp.]
MRAGFTTALARVLKVFRAAHLHHADLFTNRRVNCPPFDDLPRRSR